MGSFVHLHVHSEYSLLDGLARLPKLCEYAAESGMDAIAVTDHGAMYGTIKFDRAAEKAGIKPIFGCEMYQSRRRMQQKEHRHDARSYHLVLLAENQTGYRNLMELVTRANTEGFYYKPRIDKELLAEYADGLICLSACISGEVPALIMQGQMEQARATVGWFKELFGPDRYFLELQRHAGVPELEIVNPQIVGLANEFGLQCVATNDVHYVRKKDASAQDLLLAMQTGKALSDPDRMRMGSEDYYLMTPDEMAALFPEYPDALENTCRIAEMCDVNVGFTGYHLPKFDVPDDCTAETYLRRLCEEGLPGRYAEVTPEIRERLDHELGIIHNMGFDDYFLINHDVVDWAKSKAHMLVGPGRGSGASSIVAYLLGITDLEPLGLGLLFERFLNPGRVSMPDIDLDYPEDRRQEVIDYLTERYGQDRTSQIATFGTMAARGAVRDVGRALGVPLPDVDYVAKLIPGGPKKTIQDGLEEVPELKSMYDTQPAIRQLIDFALAVQGISRHLSTHAAGVLISDNPLVEYTPLQRAPRGDGLISQYCMEDVDAIGLLKLDVLGLSTLTVLDRAFRWIKLTHGIELTQSSIPLDDPATYALLSTGEVTGVFQVESSGMRRTLRDMQPTEFKEIIVLISLYRPGPMQFIPNYINRKFGREQVTYHHDALEPILAETYGIIVYQEQIIRIARELASYTASEGDLMRRAVGKKKKKALEEQHAKFIKGAAEHGIGGDAAEAIFADIEYFANYGFNKAHAAAYAVITIQTAFLKAHYPAEFMTALLTVDQGNTEKVAELIAECRRLGIQIRQPDVNCSDLGFSVEPDDCTNPLDRDALLGETSLAIRFGLGAIKNVGEGPGQVIIEARGDQRFADLNDFAERVDLRKLNKRVLESLVRAGALDSFGERNALLASLESLIALSQETHRAREVGQGSLFDLSPTLMGEASGVGLQVATQMAPLSEKRRLADEKELLGTFVSSHPLEALSRYLDERLTPLAEISDDLVGQEIQVAGMISSSRTITTKKGDNMAFATFEDLTGALDLTIFPSTYQDSKELLTGETVLHVHAKVERRDDALKLTAETIMPYKLPKDAKPRRAQTAQVSHVVVYVDLDQAERRAREIVGRIYHVLTETPGQVPFSFEIRHQTGCVHIDFPATGTLFTPELEQSVTALVGPEHLRVEWA